MKIYINELGHMIKMAAMVIYGKKTLKIFFSRTNGLMALKHGTLYVASGIQVLPRLFF